MDSINRQYSRILVPDTSFKGQRWVRPASGRFDGDNGGFMDVIEHVGDYSFDDLVAYTRDSALVRFPNGCFVSFVMDEDGYFMGDSPYGLEKLFQVRKDKQGAELKAALLAALRVILRWLHYWDEPRDEHGAPMTGMMDYPTFCGYYRLHPLDGQSPVDYEDYRIRVMDKTEGEHGPH